MGCSYETAKQRNQYCSNNNSNYYINNKNSNNSNNYYSKNIKKNFIDREKEIYIRSKPNESEEAKEGNQNELEDLASCLALKSVEKSECGLETKPIEERIENKQSTFNVRGNSKQRLIHCRHPCYTQNCHCQLTDVTSANTKSNNNDRCPLRVPQVTAATTYLSPVTTTSAPEITAVATITTPTPTKTHAVLPKEDVVDSTVASMEQWTSQVHPQTHTPNKECLHSYRNATIANRSAAATMASSCCTVQEMLTHARDVLTARFSHVSAKLIDNISYYAEAAAVATTGRQTTNKLKKKTKSKLKKTKTKKQLMQEQVNNQHRCRRHCNRQCCQHNMSLMSSISTIPATASTTSIAISTSTSSTAIPSSSSSQSSFPSSTSVEYTSSGTVSPVNHTITPASLTTAAGSAITAAAYNYIGHNYYHLLRNTISFYAASSVILVLCYLTTTTSAAAANSDAAPLDTHPIVNIDWSKFDESSSDKEILDMLLEKKRYDKRLLPPVNGTLTVNVNVLLLSLASPDESSLKYEVEFLLNQQWNDPRLQYGNKSHYDFLNALHHHDSIWTPDTYFIMHGDFKDPIIPMHFALRIYRNGTITYAMRRHLILSCQGSLHIFPFDDPKCSFSMESISYEVAQIKYVWKNDEDTLRKSPSLTSLNAYLIKNQTTACEQTSWRGNYSCLRVDLIFTRDRAFYFTTVFIPGIILVTSSFITFWLEWNAVPARSMIGNYSCLQVALTFTRDRAYYFTTVFIPGIILVTSSFITFWLEWNAVPARVMIGVTTMLNFFTTSNGFRSTLPVVSNLTAMNVWDGVCMCFIYASLLEFVCVNYVGRKRPLHNVVYRPGENPVTQRLPAVLSRIGVILASPLEIIEREFQTALSSEKAAAGFSSAGPTMPQTPTSASSNIHWERHYGGGMIGTAVKNLRARSMRRRCDRPYLDHHSHSQQGLSPERSSPVRRRRPEEEHFYADTAMRMGIGLQPGPSPPSSESAAATIATTTTVTVEDGLSNDLENYATASEEASAISEGTLARSPRLHTIGTNTPPLIIKRTGGGSESDAGIDETDEKTQLGIPTGRKTSRQHIEIDTKMQRSSVDIESATLPSSYPVKPPRKKTSRSTSPTIRVAYEVDNIGAIGGICIDSDIAIGAEAIPEHVRFATTDDHGEKRRDAGAPNEIVACTTCGGSSSPCTHSANNGCATETCFVQVRKKEPPHPIRVAKTIDVIARITFPTAYAIFLIFFFVHYKGFS